MGGRGGERRGGVCVVGRGRSWGEDEGRGRGKEALERKIGKGRGGREGGGRYPDDIRKENEEEEEENVEIGMLGRGRKWGEKEREISVLDPGRNWGGGKEGDKMRGEINACF